MNIKSQASVWKTKIGNSENGLSHHAFLLESDISAGIISLRDFLAEELSIITHGNPDYFEFVYEKFGIDEGRELKEMQSRHSLEPGGKKIFIIGANTFTMEAQNSLLKVFEEPTEGTHFFVLTPSARFFLPTLLSRVVCVFSEEENSNNEVSEFLKKSYADRMAYAVTLKEDLARAKRFIENLIRYFHEKTHAEKRTPETTKILKLLTEYRSYSYGRAPAIKNMIEHLSLIVPRE